MIKFSKYLFLSAVLMMTNTVNAAPLINGKAVFVEALSDTPITGEIDVNAKIMFVDDWAFFGLPMTTSNIEILDPGSYDRDGGTVTVPPDHVGAHMQLEWSSNAFFVYMVWQVTDSGATFSIIDSDDDGTPGHAMTNGPFLGSTVYYEFETTPSGPAEPNVFLVLSVENGAEQECTDDSSADVTVNALTTLVGGAELDSVSWTVDGEDAGTGLSITQSMALGLHVIEATALTTTGQSDVESTSVTVKDTIRPEVKVSFLDAAGNEVTSAEHGKITIGYGITDSCDPDPVITSSTATPTTTVADGDTMFINEKGGINLPVTAVRVAVTGKDASGNFSFTTSESSKTITLE